MVAHVTNVVSELSIGFLKEYNVGNAIIQQISAFYIVFAFICILLLKALNTKLLYVI